MVKSFSILFVGLVIPMTAALYWKKTNNPAAISSILAGVGSWIFFELVQSTYPADLIAAGIGLITLIVVTLATEKKIPARPLTDIEGNKLEYKDRLAILAFPLKRRK